VSQWAFGLEPDAFFYFGGVSFEASVNSGIRCDVSDFSFMDVGIILEINFMNFAF